MARLVAIGDTHCRFDLLEAVVELEVARDPETVAVLHVGDIGLYDEGSMGRLSARERHLIEKHKNPIHLAFGFAHGGARLPRPMFFIPGNHEDFHLVDALESGALSLPGSRMLTAGAVEHLQLGDRSVSVMGLGRIAPPAARSRPATNPKYFTDRDVARVGEAGSHSPPDILLLHESPELLVEGQGRTFGSAVLSELVRCLRPKLVLAGHMHFEFRAAIDGIPVIGLGYGAAGRYAVIEFDLSVSFESLDGRVPEPRSVGLPQPATPKPRQKPKRTSAEKRTRAERQRKPLPITASELVERYGLSTSTKQGRRTVDQVLGRLRQVLVSKGELSEQEAWAIVEELVGSGSRGGR